jgi:MFS family permease
MAAIGRKKITPYNIFILMFVGLGSMTYGYTASIIGTTLGTRISPHISTLDAQQLRATTGQPTFIEYFNLATRSNGTDLISTMNGLFQTGGVIGSLLLPTVADKWGRKWAIAVVSHLLKPRGNYKWLKTSQAALLNLISGAVLAGSTHVGEFIAFRFVAGAGAFSILAAVPVSPTTLGKREIGLME